jgi:sigma-B regulation protein RsbU (phosphoserine phosphatase)
MTEKAPSQIDERYPNLLNAIFNHHFQLTGLLDTSGRLLMVNETALKLVNAREADVLGLLFWETPWWSHSEDLQKKLRHAIEEASAGNFIRFETEPYRQ